MKFRVFQLVIALVAPVLLCGVFWPGPHGGPQFYGEVLLSGLERWHEHWLAWLPLFIPHLLLFVAGLTPGRVPRIVMAAVAAAACLTFFAMFLRGVYLPAWPVVLLSASPWLGAVAGIFVLAWFPRPLAHGHRSDSG